MLFKLGVCCSVMVLRNSVTYITSILYVRRDGVARWKLSSLETIRAFLFVFLARLYATPAIAMSLSSAPSLLRALISSWGRLVSGGASGMNFPRSLVLSLFVSCRNCDRSRRTRYSLISFGITRVWHFCLIVSKTWLSFSLFRFSSISLMACVSRTISMFFVGVCIVYSLRLGV